MDDVAKKIQSVVLLYFFSILSWQKSSSSIAMQFVSSILGDSSVFDNFTCFYLPFYWQFYGQFNCNCHSQCIHNAHPLWALHHYAPFLQNSWNDEDSDYDADDADDDGGDCAQTNDMSLNAVFAVVSAFDVVEDAVDVVVVSDDDNVVVPYCYWNVLKQDDEHN